MEDQQRERFADAVERKKQEAKQASEHPHGHQPEDGSLAEEQKGLIEHGRPQDTRSARDKNAGHGKKTADKWNQ